MTESDIVEEEGDEARRDQKNSDETSKYGMISNKYFTYQPVTLNQIDEAQSVEESKTSGNVVVTSFKD